MIGARGIDVGNLDSGYQSEDSVYELAELMIKVEDEALGRKEQVKEKAQKHTETMDRLYSKEIKK